MNGPRCPGEAWIRGAFDARAMVGAIRLCALMAPRLYRRSIAAPRNPTVTERSQCLRSAPKSASPVASAAKTAPDHV